MSGKRLRVLTAFSAIAVGLAPIAAATRIQLKGDRWVEGEIVERTDKVVKLKAETGAVMSLPLGLVLKVEPDTAAKAAKALEEKRFSRAVELSEIILFWEPENAGAKQLHDAAVAGLEEAEAKAKVTGIEAAAADTYAGLRDRAATPSEEFPTPEAYHAALSSLAVDVRVAAATYKDTAQAAPLATLLLSIQGALSNAGQEMQDRAEIARREERAAKRASAGAAAAEKVSDINKDGAEVDITKAVVPGGVTLVDFTAAWCGPCRRMAPILESLAKNNEDIYLRRVDIKEWKSPVARKYAMTSIPSVWVYGPDGKLVAERLNGIGEIQAAIASAMK